MICIGNWKKRLYISVTKVKNLVVFPFTYVSESHALFNGNFFMSLFNIDSDEQWSEARFIAPIFKKRHHFIAKIFYSALNASSPLLFREIIV